MKGLYACGEVTMTGLHGANRLASNSLLEALVYANRCAMSIEDFINNQLIKIPKIPEWSDSGTLTNDETVLITHSMIEVKQIMWDYVGIVRSNLRLERAYKRIKNIETENELLYKRTKVFSSILELRNLITCSLIIIKSAKMRKESGGLHYSIDFPSTLVRIKAKNTILNNY